jgi:hypothetical protein
MVAGAFVLRSLTIISSLVRFFAICGRGDGHIHYKISVAVSCLIIHQYAEQQLCFISPNLVCMTHCTVWTTAWMIRISIWLRDLMKKGVEVEMQVDASRSYLRALTSSIPGLD